MTHQTKSNVLAENFVIAFTGLSKKNAHAFKHSKDLVLRASRSHQYARTNQFEVEARLEGLVEKFSVVNRDDLADALSSRLKELKPMQNRWHPELLSLLLLLSDRPVENSKLEDLDFLRPPASPSPLTWAEIIADDPLDEEGIWDDVQYGPGSSEEDKPVKKKERSFVSLSTGHLFPEENGSVLSPEACVLDVDGAIYDELTESQFWGLSATGGRKVFKLSELQVIRQVIFMLGGSNASLFHINKAEYQVLSLNNVDIDHASPSSLHNLLQDFAEIGSNLLSLREWNSSSQSVPLLQTFQAACWQRLVEFDQALTKMELNYLAPVDGMMVSILGLYHEVEILTTPLRSLYHVMRTSRDSKRSTPFSYLEILFEEAEMAQLSGDHVVFDYLARLFFECLPTYLIPLQKWMEEGELDENDCAFFITLSNGEVTGKTLWHDRYILRKANSGDIETPFFVRSAIKGILSSGKSIVFLKELGAKISLLNSHEYQAQLSYHAVCGQQLGAPLVPFQALFGAAFDAWIRSKYTSASKVLVEQLQSVCRLSENLESLELLFLCKDGMVFESFANNLFEGLDQRRQTWNDRFILTELAQTLYGSKWPITPQNITVRTDRSISASRNIEVLSSFKLDYDIPWPLLNVIKRQSFRTYQQVFNLLLQCYRAKYALQRQFTSSSNDRLSQQHYNTAQTYLLRHRLIWFIDILRSYLTQIVIYPLTSDMRHQLSTSRSIDDMSSIHDTYITRLRSQCMLSENLSPMHNSIMGLLNMTLDFARSNFELTSNPRMQNRTSRYQKKNDSASEDSEDEIPVTNMEPEKAIGKKDIRKLIDEFDKQITFMIAGLRSVSRAAGDPCWDILADRLEWKKKNTFH